MKCNELNKLVEELINYENIYIEDYWKFYNIREHSELEFNVEGKKIFFKTLDGLKNIKPIREHDIIKKISTEEERRKVIIEDDYLYLLIIIKKSVIKGEWFDAINSFLNLERSYNILQEKLYYSIINII